jgi:hypothetical protein
MKPPSMNPVIVMPMNDPTGVIFNNIRHVVADLKHLFHKAIVSIPSETEWKQPAYLRWLQSDSFFNVLKLDQDTEVGQQFLALYNYAVRVCPPHQVLHLGYPDRIAYALQGPYRAQFLDDAKYNSSTPMLFQRSAKAWKTHPESYRRLESMVTELGEVLFRKKLDYAWCYLAVEIEDLKHIIPQVTYPGMAMVAEIILSLQEKLTTRDVDWLAWEDPFILDKDALTLMKERDRSIDETQKRLGYVIPMLTILKDAYLRR